MGESEIINILSNSEIFNVTNIFDSVIRNIGWWIIKILAFISNGIETIVNEIYSLNSFFSSKQLNDFINELLPLAWVILALSIVFLGYKLIFDREFRINNVFKNIALSIAVFMLLPMFMSHMEKMTTTGSLGLKSEYKLSANKVIKDNLYDLYCLDMNNFNLDKNNNIPENLISSGFINIDEAVDESLVEHKDIFKYKVSLDENGNKKKEELGNGFLGIGEEKYYRYNFDFFVIFTTLLCTTITLLATSFKVARIIFELGFVKLFALLYSFADIANGQKLKEVIRYIVSNFVVLFLISVLLKMYLMFASWSSESSKGITQLVLLIGASIAVIDGPNLIERIFGIDSGVKSGWSVVSAGYMGMKGAVSTAKGLGSMANSIKNSTIGIGSMASGFMKGFREANKDGKLEDAMNSNNNSSHVEDNKDTSSKESSLHSQMDSKDDFQISKDDNISESFFSTSKSSSDEDINSSNSYEDASLSTSNSNNMQSVNESNNLSSKESSNMNKESIENTSSLQNIDSQSNESMKIDSKSNTENINSLESDSNNINKSGLELKSLSDNIITLDEGISNLNELGQGNALQNKSLEESINDINKSNLESNPLNRNINSLDKEMNNLSELEQGNALSNKSLEESMNDINKSNLESNPLNGNINSLDKEMSKGDNLSNKSLESSINGVNKPNLESKLLNGNINSLNKADGKINELTKNPNSQSQSTSSNIRVEGKSMNSQVNNISPLDKNIKVENNSNQPRTLSGHIKQTLFDKPVVKNNYEFGRNVGQMTSNSINKIKNKNKKIFKNKKR